MQPLLLFLAVSVYLGLTRAPLPQAHARKILLGLSVLLALALYSRRFY
ncbi:MAG: hypothetical protein AAGA93_05075 [Actinomycetota bacterium]